MTTAASLADLERACVGADEKFILGQMRAGASPEAASRVWMQSLLTENTALKTEVAELKEDLSRKPSGGGGRHRALPEKPKVETSGSGWASEQFNDLVKAKVDSGMPKAKAISAVVRANPELHQAHLAEVNAVH